MPNKNYKRSRKKENEIRNELESKGYYAIRAAGSKGVADVVGIKPSGCGHADCYKVKFVQIKVSENLKNESRTTKIDSAPFGDINVEYWKFPVKTKKWYAKFKKKRR